MGLPVSVWDSSYLSLPFQNIHTMQIAGRLRSRHCNKGVLITSRWGILDDISIGSNQSLSVCYEPLAS